MGLFESGRSRLSALALIVGAGLVSSCASTPPAGETPSPAESAPASPATVAAQAVPTTPAAPAMPVPSPAPNLTPAPTTPPLQTLPPVQPAPPMQPFPLVQAPPPSGQDWRTLRRVDLPAQLLRASWDDLGFMAPGHPMVLGRTAVGLPGGVAKPAVVRTVKNAPEGIIIENLTCYNSIRGDRKCTLLLDPPNSCYLFVYAEEGAPEGKSSNATYDIDCPTRLTLGK
jgi:hypothetical protein